MVVLYAVMCAGCRTGEFEQMFQGRVASKPKLSGMCQALARPVPSNVLASFPAITNCFL